MLIPKKKRTFFWALALFFCALPSVLAAGYDVCICQTGTVNPVFVDRGQSLTDTGRPGEEGFYRVGCKAYLAVTSCKKEYVVPVDQDIQQILNANPNARVNLSYVGHWSSSRDEVRFLKSRVTPAVKSSGCTIDVYNSACRAGNNGYEVHDYLKSLGPLGERITFQGNQAISTGIWDPLAPGRNNFPVHVDSKGVRFPSCQEFEGRGCNGITNAQSNEVGVCEKENGKTEFLVCLKMEERVSRVASSGPGRPGQGGGIRQKRSTVSTTEWRSLSDPGVMDAFKRSIPAAMDKKEKYLEKQAKKYNTTVEAIEMRAPEAVAKFRLSGVLGNLEFESLDQVDKFIANLKNADAREFMKSRARECRD